MGGNQVVTAVVGAGPAGLLFCIASALSARADGEPPDRWTILLFDKRADYVRTHRLRIAREPVVELQAALADPAFDELVAFLERHGYSPSVNDLEAQLAALVAELGIERRVLDIGAGPGQLPLGDLRAHLVDEGLLPPGAQLTVVGADSVHSDVREAVRGDVAAVEHTHQTVARLRVTGSGLPERIGRLDTYRLSKVLGSVVDYRSNPNGFAEVDVFLDGPDHERLAELGATPAEPVLLDAHLAQQVGSELFVRLVDHLQVGLTDGGCTVALQSVFRLEHRYIDPVTYLLDDGETPVLLVGDAAISLPFFRGMACLVACVHALADAHLYLVRSLAAPASPTAAVAETRQRYEAAVAEVRARELGTVRARGRLVRGARELARISSLVPFPLQTWFLSIPPPRARGRLSAGFVLNLPLAMAAGLLVLAGLSSDTEGLLPGVLWWAGLFTEVAGGFAYRAAQELEPGTDTWVRSTWRAQVAVVLLAGVVLGVARWGDVSVFLTVVAFSSWFVLGLAFVAGMYGFEVLSTSLFRGADFGADRRDEVA